MALQIKMRNKNTISASLLQHFISHSSQYLWKPMPMVILVLLKALSRSLFLKEVRALRFCGLHVNLSHLTTNLWWQDRHRWV